MALAAPPDIVTAVSLSALCPKPTSADEIVVCADPEPRSPYRLPIETPPEFGGRGSASVSRERNALFDYDAGGSGLCSSVGPGGMFGCGFKAFKAMVEQRADARDQRGRVYDSAAGQ